MPAIPAIPASDEAARLDALRALRVLDTLPEPVYDDIVLLAAQICGTPIALVSLVDADRQWFKARVGLAAGETHRDLAFCAHAIVSPAPVFVVEDTTQDPRFKDNPLVTGEPHIRFYAGAPIVLPGGQAIGTVCVIDTVPRALDAAQRRGLQALARQAAALLEFRLRTLEAQRQSRELERISAQAADERTRSAELLGIVLQGGNLGLWDLHVPSGAFTVNEREHAMLGYSAQEARSETLAWQALVHPDDWPTLNAAMAPHLKGETAFYESEHRLRHKDGHWVWVLDHAVVVDRDASGAPVRIVGTHMDVTERRRSEKALLLSEHRLNLALSSTRMAVFDWDIAAGCVHRGANLSFMRGGPSVEVACTIEEVLALLHPADAPGVQAAVCSVLRGTTQAYEFEHRIRRLDGSWVWIHASGRVTERGADGRALRLSGIDEDVTARKAAEQASLDSQRRLRTIADNLPALISHFDVEERYRFLNAHHGRVFGIDIETTLGHTLREVRGEATYASLAPHVAAALRGQASSFTYADRATGRLLHYQANYIPDVDAHGQVIGVHALTFDITELQETQAQLKLLARVDALTGLANRRRFDERIEEAMNRARRTGQTLVVMYLDIDHFKSVNDSIGHAGGDAVLCEFARRLVACVRTTDTVARLAGDEFVILLEGVKPGPELGRLADKVVTSIRPPFQVEGAGLAVTASVGVAIFEGEAQTAAELLSLADRALYQAKKAGRDRYAVV